MNIKTVKFVVPAKIVNVERVCLRDELPFLCEPRSSNVTVALARKRELFWNQLKEKFRKSIDYHYEEIKAYEETTQTKSSNKDQDGKKRGL